MSVKPHYPNVFEAELPTLSYEFNETPIEIYPRVQAARQQAGIAIGPFGAEILSYELVRPASVTQTADL